MNHISVRVDNGAPGGAAETAAARTPAKCSQLSQTYMFTPVATETLEPISSQRLEFLSDLGNERRISQASDNVRENAFPFQCLSVLIQRFNPVAVQGTFADIPSEDEF